MSPGQEQPLCDGVQALSNLVWACARVDHYNEALFDAAAGRVAQSWRQLCTVRVPPTYPSMAEALRVQFRAYSCSTSVQAWVPQLSVHRGTGDLPCASRGRLGL